MRHSFRLTDYSLYSRHHDFFINIVNISQTWNLQRLRQEADQLVSGNLNKSRTKTTLNYLVELFMAMSREILRYGKSKHVSHRERDALKKCIMLPIRFPKSEHCFDQLVAATDSGSKWLIADRKILVDSFREEASLLALSVNQTEACAELLSALDLGDRRLSNIAVAISTERQIEDGPYAAKWMERAKYIDR